MDSRLTKFVENEGELPMDDMLMSDGTASFVHHQVLELARDCLLKSEEKMISSAYFYELSENLERLRLDVRLQNTYIL